MGEVGATDARDSFTGNADDLDVQRLALFMGSSGQHAASIERRQAFYSGHVQGVGFRETTRRLAAGFDVAGFVRNLDDGRVEMIAEGTPAELGRFMAAIAERMEGRIRQLAVDARPGTGEFVGFVIRQ
ncbi:acylphosphatase [Lacipirellula limnantheis]|uniref:acylphosphatase n=1 Tax=Lacipirellula limnantheis TaxID=2528024 RepID=UPI001AEF6D0F|nr:acylphosphatase [Lacipirellula limnantheis]